MVIACYAGVGKSTFAEKYPDETIDLCSMPFSWILPEKTEGEFENVKAAPYLLRNPSFPDNYIAAILEEEQKYKYVLIPTINSVLKRLYENYKIPYIICYPEIELKDEYRDRYIDRGNTSDFIDIFTEQWEDRIQLLMQDRNGRHIRLKSGMFLTDVRDKIDLVIESINTKPKDIAWRNMEILKLNEIVETLMMQGCVSFIRYDNLSYGYFPLDLREPDNRNWVFKLGKTYYGKDIRIDIDDVQFMETFYAHKFGSDPATLRKLSNKEEVMDYLESVSD